MNRVTICENLLDPLSWKSEETSDVREFLLRRFLKWPESARIYHRFMAKSADVTPYNEATVERLGELTGDFFVVVYPEGPLIIAIIAIAVAAVAIGLTFLLRPSANVKNQQQQSPNNSLTNRQNTERPNQRIPDIYGEVWATPDLIALPYRVFISHKEIEYAYMCVGRGSFDIGIVRDDTTPVSEIDGESVEVYAPNTSPNSGVPQLRIGAAIGEPVRQVKRSNAVNGQVLRAPNGKTFKAISNVAFRYPDAIEGTGSIDFTEFFAEGEHLFIDAALAVDPAGIQPSVSLVGSYYIVSVTTTEIVLSSPADINANWNALAAFSGQESTFSSPVIVSSSDGWIGPFVFTDPQMNEVWCNFVCVNGLYELDSKGNQHALNTTLELEVMAVDADALPLGDKFYFQATIDGSSTSKQQRAVTLKASLPFAGACQVRARRITNTDLRNGYQVTDQVQWRDAYGITPVTALHFGNVTTVQATAWPTQDALAIKERKLNLLVGRRLATIGGGATSNVTVDGKCQPWLITDDTYVGSGWNTFAGGGASGAYPSTFICTPSGLHVPSTGDLVRMQFSPYGDGRDLTNIGNITIENAANVALGHAFIGVLPNVWCQALWPATADHIRFAGVGPSGFDAQKATSFTTTSGLNSAYNFGERDGIAPVLVSVTAGETVIVKTISNSVRNEGGGANIAAAVMLNGWGVSTHVGDFEPSSQAHSRPLVPNTAYDLAHGISPTQAFLNAANAIDGDESTFASISLQHTHKYAGCIWNFSSPLTAVNGLRLKVLAEVAAAIITVRDAAIFYSLDNGATWVELWQSNAYFKQWAFVDLPNGTNPNQVQVMAFVDSHDDMGMNVYEVQLFGPGALVGSAFPDIYTPHTQPQLSLIGAFADNTGAVIEPVNIGQLATLTVPLGATKLQLGINDNMYANNLGEVVAQVSIIDPSVPVVYDSTNLAFTKSAADALVAMALDAHIGNRANAEVDIVGIYQTVSDICKYFGTQLAGQFCYTFDDSRVSFEESAVDIASAVFSTAYRRGSVLSIFFEKETVNSTILFNHRNKLPRSETRTVRFGTMNTNDGIELDYIDPNAPDVPSNDNTVTLYFPEDRSAVNPRKVTLIGVRNNVQAKLIGWRMFNKLKYQNTGVQFQATKEAALCILNERILVADNTRPETQDGDVLAQVALQLTLSQNVTFVGGHTYTGFFQLYDGTVEAIAVTAGVNTNQVVLASPSTLPLVLDDLKFARTTYIIVDDAATDTSPFLLAEKTPQHGDIYELKAVNYDGRYYTHDGDFIAGTLTENMPPVVTANGYTGGGTPAPIVLNTDTTDPNQIVFKVAVNGVTL